MSVLYEDNHLLVIDKPAGLPTMGAEDQTGQPAPTLHRQAVDYIRKKYNKPGRVFLGVVSRLDAMTSGVIVFPRTSKAASRLTPQFQPAAGKDTAAGKDAHNKQARKIYLAAVAGQLDCPTGTLTDHVYHDDAARRMRAAPSNKNDTKLARLRYVVVAQHADQTIVAVELLTGRKHQIRLQFASRGHAVLGDRKYGSRESFPTGIALHSWRLGLVHPTEKQWMNFATDPPSSWNTLGQSTSHHWSNLWPQVEKQFATVAPFTTDQKQSPR